MTNHASHRTLLDGIYALGEQLRAALENGAVDTFVDLMNQRGALVERLSALAPPTWVAGERDEQAARLKRQHDTILAAATVQEQHLVEAQGVLKQIQQAKTQYSRRSAPARFLNKDLCG